MPDPASTPPANAQPASGAAPAGNAAPAAPTTPPSPAAGTPPPAAAATPPAGGGSGTPPAGTGAPAAGQPPPPAAPLELKLPEGSPLSKEHLAAIKQFAEANKLPAEAAQAIVDRDHAAVLAQNDAWKQTVKGYEDALRKDPELGGAKFDATIASAKKALTQFADPEMVEALNVTGLGSFPPFVRMMHKVAKLLAEDGHTTTPPPAGNAGPRPLKDVLYTKS